MVHVPSSSSVFILLLLPLLLAVCAAGGATPVARRFDPSVAAAIMAAVGEAPWIAAEWKTAFGLGGPFATSVVAQALFVRAFGGRLLYTTAVNSATPASTCGAYGAAAGDAYRLMRSYRLPYPGIGDGVHDQQTPTTAPAAYAALCRQLQLPTWTREARDDLLLIYTRNGFITP
jgi:hypothetical protein